ncbi:MAG: YrbL family protein [Akkermansiaceae bacterium]|jgi:hypothetical protein
MLHLKDTEPLAKGNNRLVFQHPDHHELLIKVVSEAFMTRRFGPHAKWYKKRRRARQYLSYLREVEEYLVQRAHNETSAQYFQIIHGFAETDHGLGIVTTAVRGPDGALAPPLAKLIASGCFNKNLQSDLETILTHILESHLIISDLNLGNLVHNGEHFVLIDGVGNNNPIPFKVISPWLNRRSKLGRFERLRKRIDRYKRDHQIQD